MNELPERKDDKPATPDGGTAPNVELKDDTGVPQSLVYLAVGVGLLLIVGGGWAITQQSFERALHWVGLALCVGFGLVLVALGARAAGQWRSWSVTGAGAMTIALFVLVQQFAPDPAPAPAIKHAQLRGDFGRVADLRVVDGDPLYKFREKDGRRINFIVLDKRFRSDSVFVEVDTTEKGKNEDGTGKEYFELVGDSAEIARDYLNNPNIKLITWVFDYEARTISERGKVVFKEHEGRLNLEKLRPTSLRGPTLANVLRFVSAAVAGEITPQMLVRGLSADEAAVRRNARDELIAIALPAVDPLLEAFRKSPDDYRVKLGTVFCLTGILRRDPNLGPQVAKKLTDDDIKRFVGAASDADKTVRVNAAEFLFLLKDKRVVEPSLDSVREAKNPDGVFNSVVIVKSVITELSPSEQKRIKNDLEKSVPASSVKTRELIQSLPTN